MVLTHQKAPEFCLPNQNNEQTCLKDFAGKWLVLYFYPKDNTTGCTAEANDFTSSYEEFQGLGCSIVGISADSCESHQKFMLKYNLKIALLSDTDKNTLEKYGVWKEKSMYGKTYMGIERTTFLIDPDSMVRYVWNKVKTKGHAEEVKKKLMELK